MIHLSYDVTFQGWGLWLIISLTSTLAFAFMVALETLQTKKWEQNNERRKAEPHL